MKRIVYGVIAGVLLVAGCQQLPSWLQSNGVSAPTAAKVNTVMSTALADGELFCSIAGVIAAVPGVNVTHATAQSVAAACNAAQLVGTAVAAAGAGMPVPPPATPTAVPIAVVPPVVAAAVVASVKP